MNRRYFFLIILLILVSVPSCAGRHVTLMPNPSRRVAINTDMLDVMPSSSSGNEKSNTSAPKPSGSTKSNSQPSTSKLTSNYFGVDSQGNTSILTPNNSKGYIGVDKQGNAVTVTPLRGNLGVDSNGNIWTIRPR